MTSLQGHLLVASPQLLDPNFIQTVVLLIQHDEQGAMGVVLNRPTNATLAEAWEQLSEAPCQRQEALYHGGPCQGVLMAVHTEASASEIEIVPGVHFTTAAKKIEWLVSEADGIMRFFVGYAGWSAGQLEAELETGSWLTVPATSEHVFDGSEDQWVRLMKEISKDRALAGIDPKFIPKDPSLN